MKSLYKIMMALFMLSLGVVAYAEVSPDDGLPEFYRVNKNKEELPYGMTNIYYPVSRGEVIFVAYLAGTEKELSETMRYLNIQGYSVTHTIPYEGRINFMGKARYPFLAIIEKINK